MQIKVINNSHELHQFCASEIQQWNKKWGIRYFHNVTLKWNLSYLKFKILEVDYCRWCNWLRHYCTWWKVMGLIPVGVTGIFHWLNSSNCTITLGLTQPQTEMSAMSISLGWRQAVCMADNLTTFMWRLSWYMGASPRWNSQGLSRPVQRLLYLYLFF